MPCQNTGSLQPFLKKDIAALKASDRNKVNLEGLIVECSANIDKELAKDPAEANANRWDYFLCVRKRRTHFPIYVEVHGVSVEEAPKLLKKLVWLKNKIAAEPWPQNPEIPFFVAGSGLLRPGTATYSELAMNRIVIIKKGDRVTEILPP